MKNLCKWFAWAAMGGSLCLLTEASEFIDLSNRIKIETSGERSTLDRSTGNVVSTATVKLTNQGDRTIEPPFHVVVELSGPGAAVASIVGSAGGIGQPPYLFPYLELSAQVGQGLAPGGSVTFTLSLSRAAGQQVTYSLRPKAQVNRDPVAVAGGPYSGRAAEAVTLDGSASSDPDGDGITLRWLFEDGSSATGATATKAFSTSGIHAAVLEVTDAKGAQNRRSVEINIRPSGGFALGRARTLEAAGLPLRNLRIEETLAGGAMRVRQSDPLTGYCSLGSTAGNYIWKFSREGYASVYRTATLLNGAVAIIPDPRLALLETARTSVSPVNEAQLRTRDNRITLDLPSGAVLQPAAAAVTSLDAQALPMPPPANWSALTAFNFEIDQPLTQLAMARIELAEGLMPTQTVITAFFDEPSLTWKTAAVLTGTSGAQASMTIQAAGSYAVLLADQGTGAPPPPIVGAAVAPGPDANAVFDSTGVTATGTVNPEMSAASTNPDRVTATATVAFQSPQSIPSSTWFRTEVEEFYLLKNGVTIRTPDYDATVLAFRGRDGVATQATAAFPMRPQLLFGAEDLDAATIRTHVLSLAGFDGAVIDSLGGSISRNGVRFDVPASALSETTAVEMRPLRAESFSGVLPSGFEVTKAFEWNGTVFAAGSIITASFDSLSPNSHYVLGRIVFGINGFGLEPLQRFKTDPSGVVSSEEPLSGDKLPGVSASGHFLLVKTPAPLALVRGVASEGGSLVEVSGQPWMSYSSAGGQFILLAPAGQLRLLATNFTNGHDGAAVGTVVDVTQTTDLDVDMSNTGPRVLTTTPADGATDVSSVSEIRVTFTKAINPGSLGTTGMVVRDAGGAVVPASLSIDARKKVVSLFPVNTLPSAATFHVEIDASVSGANGLAVEGSRGFSFTTAAPESRGIGAQLVIYEPGAANVPAAVLAQLVGYVPGAGSTQVAAQGTAGTADPQVPVILVNETTGETATVLSKPDGSFANFVNAAEEDFVSATFVNANGTRVSVPATRQIFDDGRVGLYRQGGILEAESDAGPVQIIIEPNAIPQRTKFKIEANALAEVLAFLNGATPENATMISGLKMSAEGDPLSQAAHVVVPLPPERLGLPAGTPPDQGQFVLTQVTEVDGVKVNEVIDSMSYKDGALRTASPPFPGLLPTLSGVLYFAAVSLPTSSAFISGRVVRAPEGTTDAQLSELVSLSNLDPLPGAVVGTGGQSETQLSLRPGAFVARTNSTGFYIMKVPVNDFEAVLVFAQHVLFPGKRPSGAAVRGSGPLLASFGVELRFRNLAFLYPKSTTPDKSPPLLTLEQESAVLPVDTESHLTLHIFDNASPPTLQSIDWVRSSADAKKYSFALADGSPLVDEDVEFARSGVTSVKNAVSSSLAVVVKKAAVLILRATAVDQSGNKQTQDFAVRFGPKLAAPNDSLQPSDPNDSIPPRVTSIRPGPNEVVSSFSEIVVSFSEAVSQDIETNKGAVGVVGSISNGVPVQVELAPDHLSAIIRPIGLQPGDDVNVSLSPVVRDLKGNELLPFSSNFKIAGVPSYELGESSGVAATVAAGNFAYSLRRSAGASGGLLVHQLGDSTMSGPVGELVLPPHPRAITYVPKFAFKRRTDQPVEEKPLLIIAGGLTGEGRVGQWLWVVDISDPMHPARVASQLAVPDFLAAVSLLKYSDGRIFMGVNTFEVSVIYKVVLQTFILGSNYTFEDFAKSPEEGDEGLDLDHNGDFVGPGERLPIPVKRTLFGFETAFPLAPGPFLFDFDSLLGGAYLVTNLAPFHTNPGRLQVVYFGGGFIGSGDNAEGAADISEALALRVLLEPNFEVQTPTGTGSIPFAAIVSAGPKLLVYDISSDPHHPTIVRSLELPQGSGSILSLDRDGDGRFLVGTTSKLFELDRKLMGEPQRPMGEPSGAIVGSFALQSVRRTVGVSDAFVVGMSGGKLTVQPRAPRISVVRFPTHAVLDTSTIAGMQDPEKFAEQLLDGIVEENFLTPSPLRAFGDAFPSALANPPPPKFHYYVLVRASGSLGPQLKLAIESTDRHGRRLPPRGSVSPPVILTDHPAAAGVYGAQPAAEAQVANRMSNDPTSKYYNLYLSQPLLVARDPVSTDVLNQIKSLTGRQAVQMGERLRISLEDASNTAGYDSLFTHTPSHDQPPSGLSESVDSFCGDFVDSLNPSMQDASPRVDGVSLQSCEFSHRATDLIVEGRGLDMVVSRNYQSQTHYRGAFGRGWDCPFFRRLCDLPSGFVPAEVRLPLTFYGDPADDQIARPGDVMIQDGAGDLKLYRQISAANGNMDKLPLFQNDPAITEFGWGSGKIEIFYQPPPGSFDMLVRFTDGSYVSIDPEATRHYYDAEGRITRMVTHYDEAQLKFEYRADGKLDKVIGDNGTNLEFGYYGHTTSPDFKSSVDEASLDAASVGLISRIKAGVNHVEYAYDANGSLKKANGSSSTPQIYGYDTAVPFLLTVIGRQDGTEGPSQKVTYTHGIVTQIETNGVKRTFNGAVATAEARHQAGGGTVSVTTNGAIANFGVNVRGQPTSFAGKDVTTSVHGQIQSFGTGNEAIENVYDSANPVYRFRGNLLMIKGQGGQSSAAITYDNTTWNRILTRTSPAGVRATIATSSGMGHNPGTTVTFTTGPNERKFTLNEWGQVTFEERSEGGITFRKETLYTGGLPSGTREGSRNAVSMTRDATGRLGSVSSGGLTQNLTIGAQGEISAVSAGAGGPSMTFGYDVGTGNQLTTRLTGGAGSVDESLSIDSANPNRLSGFSFAQTGVPEESGNFSYDAHGLITGYTSDAESVAVTWNGVLPASYDAPGEHNRATYGAGGRVATFHRNGLDATFGYDDQGRLVSLTHAGASQTFTYNLGQQVASQSVTGAGGVVLDKHFNYDGAGRLSEVVGATVTKKYTYFPDDTVRSVTLGNFEVARYERDDSSYLTGGKFFGGAISISLQNLEPVFGLPRLQTTTYIDGSAVDEALTYDGAGRILTHAVGGLAATTSTYDSFGNPTSTTDPDGVIVSETNSPMGLPLTRTFGDGTNISITYNAAWQVLQRGAVGFGYNSEGLISSVTFPDGSSAQFQNLNSFLEPGTVSYGSLTQTHSYANGRRTGITAGGDSLDIAYDEIGRVMSLTLNGYQMSYGYSPDLGLKSEQSPLGKWEIALNAGGNITSETYPSGVTSSFSPGVAGLMTQHPAAGATAVTWADLEVLKSITYAGGVTMTRHFDAAMRPFKTTWEKGGALMAGLEWNLTDGGRVNWVKRLHSNLFDVYQRNLPAQGMRVTGARFSASDATGATAARTISGLSFADGEVSFASASTTGAGAQATAPLPGDALSHDDRGVVTAAPVWVHRQAGLQRVNAQFDYDGFLQLRAVRLLDGNGDVEVTVTYERNGAGRIVHRTVVGDPSVCVPGEFKYMWHDDQLIEEYSVVSGSNQLAARYFWAADELIRIERADTPGGAMTGFIPLTDINGSVGGYLDDAGVLREEVRYGLYGLPSITGVGGAVARSLIDGRLLFQGAFFEPETGIYDMGRRTLHSVFGEFLQRDSQFLVHSKALYTAFDGDPASNVDREGAAVGNASDGRSGGWWKATVDGVVKGGFANKDTSKGVSAYGLNWKLTENSQIPGLASKTLGFASEFFPKHSLPETALSGLGAVTNSAKLLVENAETSYKVKEASDSLKSATKAFNTSFSVLRNASNDWFENDDDIGPRLDIFTKSARHVENTKKLPVARLKLRKERLSRARFRVGVAAEFYKAFFKPKQGASSPAYEAGNRAFDAAGIILEVAGLKTAAQIGGATGMAELSVAGGSVSGAVSSLGMRALFVVQAADLGFRFGEMISPYLYDAISPQAGADYRAAKKQFDADGGFNLKIVAGMLSSVGLSDKWVLKINKFSDLSFTAPLTNYFDGIRSQYQAWELWNEYYLNGLSAP